MTTEAQTSRYTPSRILNGISSRLTRASQPITWLPSRYVFGNFAGFFNNVVPRLQLRQFQTKLPQPQPSADQLKAARQLHDLGFATFPKYLDDSTLRRIVEKYRAGLADPARSVSSPNGATRFFYRPFEHIPELRELLSDEVRGVLSAYYGCPFRVINVSAWRNHHVPGVDAIRSDVFSNTFHHDGTPYTGLRLFVLLCDGVTRETGSFRFHDRVVSQQLARSVGFYSRWWQSPRVRERLVSADSLRFFEGNLGDACLVNTQTCLHGASVPKTGTFRDIVQFKIMPVGEAVSDIFDQMPVDTEIEKMRR